LGAQRFERCVRAPSENVGLQPLRDLISRIQPSRTTFFDL
jgi:hypothetical protein